MSFYAVGY